MKRRILNITLIALNILVIVLFIVQYTSATCPMTVTKIKREKSLSSIAYTISEFLF